MEEGRTGSARGQPAWWVRASLPVNQPEERALIEAAQHDPSRFAELYELHFARVYAYIVRRVRERSATEELTAHVFHQALANLSKFKWRGAPFAAWLFRIAANSIADRAKRLQRESEHDALVQPVNLGANSESDLEQVETVARVYQLVEELPWDQRDVIRLRFAEEKSIREIAQRLSRSEGAIKQLQFRALQNLRARMSEKNV
ncbi:MAG: sigma-70 family RNA polymerase sigma factor [Acidobacteriota bacterium]